MYLTPYDCWKLASPEDEQPDDDWHDRCPCGERLDDAPEPMCPSCDGVCAGCDAVLLRTSITDGLCDDCIAADEVEEL